MPLFTSGTDLSDDEQMLLDIVRAFAESELLPLDRKWDEDESSVVEVLPKLGEMGLLSLSVPEDLDGLGCSYRLYAAILHEISIWSPSTAVTLSVHNMVGKILAEYLGKPLREAIVSRWGEPKSFAAFALSEAGAGSDADGTKASAVEVKGGFQVNGEKMWISNGLHSRWLLTLVRLQGAPAGNDLCALLIDGHEPGLERTKIHGKMGIRGSETAVIYCHDVFVPEDRLIGQRGEGLKVFLSTLNEGRIGIAAQASGIAEACLNEMRSYARQREQFGQPIGKFQAVANMIADSATELEAARALIIRAAGRVDAGVSDPAASSMAKLYASEAANRIAYRAVQVHGGTGYVHECRVEQLYRDARITTIYEGTSEIQRVIIARELRKRVV